MLALFFILLIKSFNLKFSSIFEAINYKQIMIDTSFTFLRVTGSALVAWFLGIFAGYSFYKFSIVKKIGLDSVNFFRHISPYALLPFAIIWFGLGEIPLFFIMFIALFSPSLVASNDIFSTIDKSYIEEAAVLGSDILNTFLHIEIPIAAFSLLNQFRIIWGLGWATVIAAEMLGVKNGLGSRLLDFRYLLQYPQMIQYLLIMGITGIFIDKILVKVAQRFLYE
ncbi:MAG: ABC transporter permease subunit [Candidatus Cloacimonadota bacterium]|nr:ABC transporter permease subunit [Candidatus Cloacimonadota bacterium]